MIYFSKYFMVMVALFLCACGGGGSSTTPTQNPPPPPPAVNSSLNPLTENETFEASSAAMDIHASGGFISGASTPTIRGINDNATVQYRTSGQSFQVSINQGGIVVSLTFAESDRNTSASQTLEYEVDGGALVLDKPGVGNSLEQALILNYMTYGGWIGEQQTNGDLPVGWIAFGVDTASADMPSTGSATFNGVTEGMMVNSSNAYILDGKVAIQANFATGGVEATFSNMRRFSLSGVYLGAWRDFSGSLSIASGTNRYAGTANTNDAVLSGSIEGAFYGAAGSSPTETGGVWELSNGTEDAIGAFGASTSVP